ncbi:inosine-5'-monophosphate dehydrogenase [Streptomyces sp. NTH33]|uniref:CBS domain-containing protein n=1 Tax=Streptomyces sp. NTH33 TaxID=1735453 RepID=UPI000DA7C990|nr:CBS domain-containing protein [Streptomyces sp. NTH33]PZH20797.1 inosine-5'-monophosphate dehydrogenase [Streptomyces sp. NTH33]
MHHRTVEDLMTHGVVRVRQDTPFKDVVRTLADHDVTAVPVVDDLGHPVGVVSEADLLRTVADRPDPAGLLPRLPPDRLEEASDGATAEELMTAPPVCARPGWSIVEAARTMDTHKVKRLPVVDEAGVLTGIVSRSDLLRIFLRRDEAIREEIADDVLVRTLGLSPADLTVTVREGRVALKGTVEARSLVPVIERLCRGVDGVVSVSADITGPADDPSGPSGHR